MKYFKQCLMGIHVLRAALLIQNFSNGKIVQLFLLTTMWTPHHDEWKLISIQTVPVYQYRTPPIFTGVLKVYTKLFCRLSRVTGTLKRHVPVESFMCFFKCYENNRQTSIYLHSIGLVVAISGMDFSKRGQIKTKPLYLWW